MQTISGKSKIEKELLNGDLLLPTLDRALLVTEYSIKGEIVFANQNFLNVMGISQEEIIGKHHQNYCAENFAHSTQYNEFWSRLTRGENIAGTYKRVNKFNKIFWLQSNYLVIKNKSGEVERIVEISSDVTASKESELAFIKNLTEASSQLARVSEEFIATANQLYVNSQETAAQSTNASAATVQIDSGVRNVATNVEEMTASIVEITRTTNEASSMTNETMRLTQDTNNIMSQLGNSSHDIGNVIKVISSIAQQTNLLALNATIEAARAGEAGKGFAVVANEVKELAKQTGNATGDIVKKIEAIQTDTVKAVNAIEEISIRINKVNGYAGNIAAAVEEQAATTNEISRIILQSSNSITGVSKLVKEVSTISKMNTSDASQLIDASKALSKLALVFSDLITQLNL